MKAQQIHVPTDCALHASAADADFADSWLIQVPHTAYSALDIYRLLARTTPGWIDGLMQLRNQLVRPFGLRNLGKLSAVGNEPAQVGRRLGLFEVCSNAANELVLQDNDRHLRVQLSLQKRNLSEQHDQLCLTTVVQNHQLLGRVYMAFVGPAHRVIVPAMLGRAAQALRQSPP